MYAEIMHVYAANPIAGIAFHSLDCPSFFLTFLAARGAVSFTLVHELKHCMSPFFF